VRSSSVFETRLLHFDPSRFISSSVLNGKFEPFASCGFVLLISDRSFHVPPSFFFSRGDMAAGVLRDTLDLEKAALRKFVRDFDLLNEAHDRLETLVVITFHRDTPRNTISWVYRKLTQSVDDGGAELVVSARIDPQSQVSFCERKKKNRRLLGITLRLWIRR
jgi:hypothetical protein